MIKPEKRLELIKDLEERTGLKINRVEIQRIDYIRDMVRLVIYYYQEDNLFYGDDSSDSSDDDD
jgi:hypothetical protein